MLKRPVVHSPRITELKKKRQASVRNKIFIIGMIVIALSAALAFLLRWEKINIVDIEVVGNKVIDTSDIKNFITERTEGYYIWLFPKTSFLLYPKDLIQHDLEETFKRFTSVKLELTNINTLLVTVEERGALYTWCGTTLPEDESSEDCYFIDDKGYIFNHAPNFSGDVYFRLYGRTSSKNADSPLGTYFAKQNISKLRMFKESLDKMELEPAALYIDDQGEEAELYLADTGALQHAPKILFKTNTDFNKIAENLQSAFTIEPLKTDFKKKYSSLVYIDLRFGNKVYYKFQ